MASSMLMMASSSSYCTCTQQNIGKIEISGISSNTLVTKHAPITCPTLWQQAEQGCRSHILSLTSNMQGEECWQQRPWEVVTLTALAARLATRWDVAASTPMTCPTQVTTSLAKHVSSGKTGPIVGSPGTSLALQNPTTPGKLNACVASRPRMRACGIDDVTRAACKQFEGKGMSSVYTASPDTCNILLC